MGNTAKETESMEQADRPPFILDAVGAKKEAVTRRAPSFQTGRQECLSYSSPVRPVQRSSDTLVPHAGHSVQRKLALLDSLY